MTSLIPLLNGSLLQISIGQKPPGIACLSLVQLRTKGEGLAIVESNAVGQLQKMWISSFCLKLQNILNYNVGKFKNCKQVFASGIIFFLICGDKSLPKIQTLSLKKQRVISLLDFLHRTEAVIDCLLKPNMSKTCDSSERLTSVFVSVGLT